jgi:hypothetical protein
MTSGPVGARVCVSLALALVGVAGTPFTVEAAGIGQSPTRTDTAGTVAAAPGGDNQPARVVLPRPVRGATAIRLLGDELDEAAFLNDVTTADLVALLRSDATAWVDTAGAVFFKDESSPAPATESLSAGAALDQTLLLHSKPGSAHTIFLDFDGGAASETAWHWYAGVPTTQPAWDPSGNGTAFDADERTRIQTIWQTVAEDYAPFDVDVTTADPGSAAITRSSAVDPTYGSRVLITPSIATQQAICSSGCGGVAYYDVFDAAAGAGGDGYGFLQPAWVFPHQLGNSAKNIAEAVSHEVGHNFGLDHDAKAPLNYYAGHGAWAPIMGVGYNRPITQWSKGDYTGATTTEDDVGTIRGVAGARVDEAGASIVSAAVPPTGTAYVTNRTDIDTYVLGTCAGAVTVSAQPPTSMPNLDIRLSLVDAGGQVIASADPASAQSTASVASGMGAALTQTVPPGTYYASVDGVGHNPGDMGYDDYGSLGAYTLTASTSCSGGTVATDAPPVPGITTATSTSLSAAASGSSVTLDAGVSPTVAGTVRFTEGDTVVGTVALTSGAALLTLLDVASGEHTYIASFVPADSLRDGPSSSSPRTVSVAAAPAPVPLGVDTPTPVPPTVSGISASTTKVVAPRRAAAGSRPVVRVSVLRGTAPVAGKVVVTVDKKKTTIALTAGKAKLKLSRVRPGKVKVVVRYLGDASSTGSAARKVITVRR